MRYISLDFGVWLEDMCDGVIHLERNILSRCDVHISKIDISTLPL